MNRFILSILILLTSVKGYGQMFPLSDHYIYDALTINPAFAGSHDALSATILYRNQWIGFKDAPASHTLSVHTPVLHDRIGVGLLVNENSIGIFKETSFIGNYAYRMEVYNGILALGLGFGASVFSDAWDRLEAADEGDVYLMNVSGSAVLPEFSLGAYYYKEKYYIGLSIPSFLNHEVDHNTGKYKIKSQFPGCNYFLSAGYEIAISPMVKIMPSVLVKFHPDNALQVDYSAQLNLKDRIWLGFGYRNKDVLVSMLQCQINYQLRMAYSYDYEFSSIGKYKNGSHEIVLSYVLRYRRNVMGPRMF